MCVSLGFVAFRRIVLINPYIEEGGIPRYFQTDWTSAEFSAAIRLPSLEFLGIHAILTANGFDVGYLDANDNRLSAAQIAAQFADFSPDLCIVYANGRTTETVKQLVAKLKSSFAGAAFAAFGAPLTGNPGLVLGCSEIDFVILGEPEWPALQLARGNRESGLAFMREGQLIRTPLHIQADLDQLPPPSRHLLQPQHYQAPFSRSNPFTVIVTSRGCVYGKCTFCTQNVWTGSGVRYHGVAYVLGEIRTALKLGYKEIFFRDEVFTENRERTIELCRAILATRLRFSWRAMTRVALVDAELLALMKQAGCYQISYGFETSSAEVLRLNKKGQSLKMASATAAMTKRAGIEIVGNFVIGLAGDTQENLQKISRYAKELGCDFAQFTVADTWNGYQSAETLGILNRQELVALARKAYYSFYLDPRFLFRMAWRLARRPAMIAPVSRAFLRSLMNPVLA